MYRIIDSSTKASNKQTFNKSLIGEGLKIDLKRRIVKVQRKKTHSRVYVRNKLTYNNKQFFRMNFSIYESQFV